MFPTLLYPACWFALIFVDFGVETAIVRYQREAVDASYWKFYLLAASSSAVGEARRVAKIVFKVFIVGVNIKTRAFN